MCNVLDGIENMNDSLFPEFYALPNGFDYIPDFLNEDEEQSLVKSIRQIELHPFRFHGFEAKRRVASFGFDYGFETGHLLKGQPIPAVFEPLVFKAASHLSIDQKDFGELLVLEYPPGAVINWHRDAPPFKIICGISLLEDCVFRLRPHDKDKQGRKTVLSLPVRRRSMYVIRGEARTSWQHSILPVKRTRYSITLRTLNTSFVM
jgi:alkylated DNA repair dioxygenase AlkB